MNSDITPEVTREEFWRYEGYRYSYLERVAIMVLDGHVPECFARLMAIEFVRKEYERNKRDANDGIQRPGRNK